MSGFARRSQEEASRVNFAVLPNFSFLDRGFPEEGTPSQNRIFHREAALSPPRYIEQWGQYTADVLPGCSREDSIRDRQLARTKCAILSSPRPADCVNLISVR